MTLGLCSDIPFQSLCPSYVKNDNFLAASSFVLLWVKTVNPKTVGSGCGPAGWPAFLLLLLKAEKAPKGHFELRFSM